MFRRVIPALVPALLALSGCAKEDSSQLASTNVATRVVQAKSGGELLFIAGGQLILGDAQGYADETPHEVYVDALYMDKHPVSRRFLCFFCTGLVHR